MVDDASSVVRLVSGFARMIVRLIHQASFQEFLTHTTARSVRDWRKIETVVQRLSILVLVGRTYSMSGVDLVGTSYRLFGLEFDHAYLGFKKG